MSFWNLLLGNWFLNLNSGWNIQINPRRIGGQRKSERGAVILSIGGELDRPGSFRQATPFGGGPKELDVQAFSPARHPLRQPIQLAEGVEFTDK